MPNLKSAKKRAKQSEKRHLINLSRKTGIKTAVRKVLDSLQRKEDIEITKKLLRDAEAKFARAKSKGVIHRNTASRKISRLAMKVSASQSAQAGK